MSYSHETDCKGEVLRPGDRVSAKAWRRRIQGVIVVSGRAVVVNTDGSTAPALSILTDDGTLYSLPSPRAVRKLSRPSR